jgi:hypothetical protein
MNNDLISRESLIKAVEDLYEYAELGEVLDVIKEAPTVNDCPNCEYKKQFDYISGSGSYKELQALRAHKKESFTREELKAWLYAIAINNLDGLERDKVFADDCKEIIDRLDGFERFVKDRREGKI